MGACPGARDRRREMSESEPCDLCGSTDAPTELVTRRGTTKGRFRRCLDVRGCAYRIKPGASRNEAQAAYIKRLTETMKRMLREVRDDPDPPPLGHHLPGIRKDRP